MSCHDPDDAGTIDWGYLNADKVNMDPKYSAYELVGAEGEGAGLPRGQPGNAGLDDVPGPPMGRGRDMVKPAWMQAEGQQAPGQNLLSFSASSHVSF